MSQRFVLQDGVHRSDGQVHLDADDQALLLGRGVFETLRTYDGRLFGLAAHLDRLLASAAAAGIQAKDRVVLSDELTQAASAIDSEAVVRITLTHGGHRIVRSSPLQPALSSYRCATRQWVPPAWLDGSVKHTSRAFSIVGVEDAGVDEVIWVDEGGDLLEGTRSNVFAAIDGVLCTPALDGRQLAGITRAALIRAARDAGVPVSERPMHKAASFDELYLSSTLKELSPIGVLDGHPAPGSGPVGDAVSAAFQAAIRMR